MAATAAVPLSVFPRKKQSPMRARRSGFTLIELLIVILVAGILATVSLSRLWSVRGRAHVSAMQNDLRSLASQQEAYFSRGGYSYTTDLAYLSDFVPSDGVVITINYAASDGWGATAYHPASNGRQCGIFVPAAPVDAGTPATQPGIIMCN
jgi:prepilin-type N-terminal cleavage/methylation domain-containing protein